MKASELPNALRELADRLEAANLEGDDCDIDIAVHNVKTREALADWARLIGKCEVSSTDSTSYLRSYTWRREDRIGYAVHFTPGLLGGKVIEIRKDDAAGLDALLAEGREKVGAA